MDKNFNNPEEEAKDSKIKKIFVIIIALFLIFLITSYLVGGYFFQILGSISESEKSSNHIIQTNSITIEFESNTYKELQDHYLENQEVEIIACLKGNIEGNKYFIDELFKPKILEQTVSHVSYEGCPKETLITLHSHPFKRCIASQQDIKNLEEVKSKNPHTLMIIMCQKDRFSVYE